MVDATTIIRGLFYLILVDGVHLEEKVQGHPKNQHRLLFFKLLVLF